MKGLIYVSLVAVFLAFSWCVRILVSKNVTKRVEDRYLDNG